MSEIRTGEKRGKSEIWIWIQVCIAAIGLFFAIYTFSHSEKTKQISVSYFSKHPLVDTESSSASSALQVKVGNKMATAPWLLSGRLENTGNVPIELNDVEEPVKIAFLSGKILGAEISQRSQQDIYANLNFDSSSIEIHTKLLNPGDWVNFDIIFDGQPEIPGIESFRINGISTPIQLIVPEEGKKIFLTFFNIPKTVTKIILGYLIFVIISLILYHGDTIKILIKDIFSNFEDSSVYIKFEKKFKNSNIKGKIYPKGKIGLALYALIDEEIEIEKIDNIEYIEELVSKRISFEVLMTLGVDVKLAGRIISKGLKDDLKIYLSNQIFWSLPSGLDKEAKEIFLKIEAEKITAVGMVQNAMEIVVERASGINAWKNDKVYDAILMILACICMALIIGGTIKNMILM
jgi:hypothetical protein